MIHTLLIGTDFRTSSLKMREEIHIDQALVPHVIDKIKAISGISECAILVTCNRLEIYVACDIPEGASLNIINFLSSFHSVPEKLLSNKMYILRCGDAARHLFRVAAGLESMVFGETEILGQIKRAYELSKSCGGTGPVLNKLFQGSISLGKEARHRTEITRGPTSVAAAAAHLACRLAEPKSARYCVIGCGQTGKLTAKILLANGARNVIMTNRTEGTGKKTACNLGVNFASWNKLISLISKSDIVISCISSKETIVKKCDLVTALKGRHGLTIIDLAVPRNIDESAKGLSRLSLYSIDDLREIIDSNIKGRKKAEKKIECLIDGKTAFFTKWYVHKNGSL